jgi:hypothetical protein
MREILRSLRVALRAGMFPFERTKRSWKLPIAHFIGGKAADLITNIALLIASTAPQAMLAIENYLDLRAFSLTANRSESIGNWMRRADIFLDKADHKQESTAPIFERLGREALNETSDWLVLHSSRELRPL